MNKYKIKQIDLDYINNNKDNVFEAWKNAWHDSYWGEIRGWDKEEELTYLKWLVENGELLFAFDEEEIIVGIAACSYIFSEPINKEEKMLNNKIKNDFPNYVYLQELVICPKYRGQGLGTRLMKKKLKIAKEKGKKDAVLWTEVHSKSRKLYERLGFEYYDKIDLPKKGHPTGVEKRVYYHKPLS